MIVRSKLDKNLNILYIHCAVSKNDCVLRKWLAAHSDMFCVNVSPKNLKIIEISSKKSDKKVAADELFSCYRVASYICGQCGLKIIAEQKKTKDTKAKYTTVRILNQKTR